MFLVQKKRFFLNHKSLGILHSIVQAHKLFSLHHHENFILVGLECIDVLLEFGERRFQML